MRISRLYIARELAEGDAVVLGETQAHYVRNVLRLKPTAGIRLFNGRDPFDYGARIEYHGRRVVAHIEALFPAVPEAVLRSQILQGLARPDHVDWMLQKTVELGVANVIVFNAARTQAPLKAGRVAKKLEHWRGVASSACEQCGRAIVPGVDFLPNLGAALAAAIPGRRLLLDPAGSPLPRLLTSQAGGVAILLGPEGGLDDVEIQLARQAGFASASLGPRILRTETAAAAGLAIIQSLIGDMA